AAHAGRRVAVFGGGDSAVEAAVSCAEAGAEVTVSYRKDGFHRAKKGNKDKIDALIKAGTIRFEPNTTAKEITPETVVLNRGDEQIVVPNDDVLIFFGTKLPKPFLDKIGLRFAGQMDAWRVAWIVTFAMITYCFYVLKAKKDFFPFGPGGLGQYGNWFGAGGLTGIDIPTLLKVDLGFRMVDASFWGTCMYAVLILVFGIEAYRKYPLMEQKKRYLSLITFQLFFLFAIPELLGPLIIEGGRGYKLYALSVPWPLSIWSVIEGPNWGPGGPNAAIGWILLGCLSAFVLIPLYVRFNGERFCSYMCGCGGLAETLGDRWRHLAPRGSTSYKAEWFGKAILVLAIPVTLMILIDAWQLVQWETLSDVQRFSTAWYSLMVDFWLASVVGVAFYPYLGNRVWCRFFCPLRAYMELLSKWFSKIAINANDKCIGCGECTRYCQMGIQVQNFAQRQEQFHNGNSACIQCGICIQVCPMEVLSIGERGVALKIPKKGVVTGKPVAEAA
ncbi:MAG: NAD(P)-binding domain-containing protein, partial [Myxococcota bacterium]